MSSRVRSLCLALAVLAAAPAVGAQDWRDDDSIWGFDDIGGPHRGAQPPPVPSIVPTEWIAVPASNDEAALVAFPWILDPERAAPKLGENGWTKQLAPPFAAVACASTTIASDADDVRMARLTGARFLVVNGSVHVGDPERRGDRGVPIALRKGANHVLVVDASAGWELELWEPPTRCVIGTWDVGWPHVTEKPGGEIEYPVFNASVEPISTLHVHYGHGFVPSASCRTQLTDWCCVGVIAPLSLLIRGHYFAAMFDGCTPTPGRVGNRSPVCVYAGNDNDPARDPEGAREILCDLDSSFERSRLSPRARAAARGDLVSRPQGRIPTEVPGLWGPKQAVLVYGTRGDAQISAALLARARLDQQVLWYACGEVPLVLSDVQYAAAGSNAWLAEEVRDAPLVIYGAPSTNSACEGFVAFEHGRALNVVDLVEASAESEGFARTVLWVDSKRAALGYASTGLAGARLSLAIAMRDGHSDFVRVDPASIDGFRSICASRK